MSMNYFIYSDIEPEDTYDEEIRDLSHFPYGLSFFFEQVGGYDECAEVSQVCELLNIDLDLFQNVDFPENPHSSKTWQTIEVVVNKLDEFSQAIKKNPKYFEKVLHGGERHPPDYGYLSKNVISQDIQTLKNNLQLLKEKGSKKLGFFTCRLTPAPNGGFVPSGRHISEGHLCS